MKKRFIALGLIVSTSFSAIALAQAPAAAPSAVVAAATNSASTGESGLAAVYSDRLAGHLTASGKKYDPRKLTAAHKTLAFGTRVRVTNEKNGKSVELRITDRGPRQAERILDISPRAAHALGMSKYSMAQVKLEVVEAR